MSALQLEPEAVRLAKLVTFAESCGGPLIVMSESVAASWHGICDSSGNDIYGTAPSDYDRACDGSFSLIDVGCSKALTLETPDNGTFVPRPDGSALIVRWIGADDAETLLSAALALPSDRLTDHVGELPHGGGKLVMFDSALRGTELVPGDVASIELPAAVYLVRMCVEWRGEVLEQTDSLAVSWCKCSSSGHADAIVGSLVGPRPLASRC